MDNRTMHFWIGTFVLGSIAALLTLMYWFGDLPSILSQHRYIAVSYENANGVGVGTPVRKNGIRVGEVVEITFDERGPSAEGVMIIVDLSRPVDLKEGTVPLIARGLLGDTTIELQQGPGPAMLLASITRSNAPILQGETRADPAKAVEIATEAISRASQTLATIDEAAKAISKVTASADGLKDFLETWKVTGEKVGRGAGELEKLLGENSGEIGPTLSNLREISQKLNTTLDAETQAGFKQAIARIQVAADGLAELRPVLRELGDTTNAKSSTQMAQAVQRINKVAANLQLLTDSLSTPDGRLNTNGSLQKLLTSPELADNANRLVILLNETLGRFRPIMGDLGLFARKIAQDPASLTRGALQR